MELPAAWDDLEKRFCQLNKDEDGLHLSVILINGVWVITGAAEKQFVSFAKQAAVGGDLVAPREDPLESWLNHLRRSGHFSPAEGEGGFIHDPCSVSAKCCVLLKGEAVSQRARKTFGLHQGTAAPAANAEYRFRQTAEGWTIAYGDETWSGKKRLGGLSLIQTLLGNPRRPYSSAALIGRELVKLPDNLAAQSGQSSLSGGETLASARHSTSVPDVPSEVSARPVSSAHRKAGTLVMDAQARREARERRDEIKMDLDLGRVPDQDIPKLKKEYLQLCDYLKKGPAGQVRKDNPDQERARTTAQGRYSRALKFLTDSGLNGLRNHLKESIASGHSFTYQPKSDVDWRT